MQGKDYSAGKMVGLIRELTRMIRNMVQVYSNGQMGENAKENGEMECF